MRSKVENAILSLFSCGLEIPILLSGICRYLESLYLLFVKPITKTVSNKISNSMRWVLPFSCRKKMVQTCFLKLFMHQEVIYSLNS